MKKKYMGVYSAIVLALCVISCSFLMLTGCGKDNSGTYTVTVVTEGGKAFEEIGVYVYEDKEQGELVCVAKTDKEGKASFESEDAMGCYIVLKDVPSGYNVDTYEISEKDTTITLNAELLKEDQLEGMTFKLGDVFADMAITSTDGVEYQLSELLKEKKAVVLNFWYLNCDPCRGEFPYLDEAYEQYKDVVEVIAVNPYDGTDEKVAKYKEDLGLSIPMAAIDYKWHEYMQITAYPTTVVIDQYGTIALIHKGSVTETETFTTIFEYFTAEDYKQTTIRNVEDILKEK